MSGKMSSEMKIEEKTAVTISRDTLKKIQDVQMDIMIETRKKLSQEAVILVALEALEEKRSRQN
jgi:hypothetical protein